MRVLVNALSVNNLSGRHVLLGHLSRLAEWTRGEHEYQVLIHKGNRDLCRDLGANVDWQQCPDMTTGWVGRAAWEVAQLDAVGRRYNADFVFLPSGTVVPGLALPQVSFAQNPWALADGIERSAGERAKAALQRSSYSRAVREAAMMVYNSEYMRRIYRGNAGRNEISSRVVYQAVDDETHTAATRRRNEIPRDARQILSVSAMAPHKGAETLVAALAILRNEQGVPGRLVLAGGWPNRSYRARIESLIEQHGLRDCIDIRGHVSRDELHKLYAESRVFSLMSRCESFGIPAVEAQAFGTPVVSSNCCAIPEVCGSGGVYPEVDDANEVALQWAKLINDDAKWEALSQNALENASRFRWETCSLGLLEMFNHV